MRITSPKNPLLKEIRRASARGSLTSEGLCIAEGFHLLDEAQRSGCTVQAVLVADRARDRVGIASDRLFELPDELFDEISSTENSQGVIALVEPPMWSMRQLFHASALVLILDGIQDPGNAGAMLRAAEAFGASGVVLLKGTVSPYNTKVIRASAGSLFRLPVAASISEERLLEVMAGHHLFAAMPHDGVLLPEADLVQPCALMIGGEGAGVNSPLAKTATPIRIPTVGVESLNAAAAASVLLYESWRQRHRR